MTVRTEAPKSRRRRTALFVGLGLLAVLVIAAAWVGVRAMMAKGELDDVASLVGAVKTAAADRDLSRLDDLAEELATHADRAASLSSDPVWRLSEGIPWLGPNLAAVRVASEQLDAVSRGAVLPLLGIAADMQKGSSDGALDVKALDAARTPLVHAAATVRTAARELSALNSSALIGPLARGIEQLRDVVVSADTTMRPLAEAGTVLPGLLGADGPRTLLLVIQNNAELRTGGGITGTFVEMRADGGKLTMQHIADSSQFPHRADSILPVPSALTTLYGDVVGRFVQDASIPADFDLTGRLVSAWWTSSGGEAPDAVISIDPIVLQSLLAATGPVALPDGSELSSENLVQRLMVDPYMTMTSDQQTAFFAAATSAVFSRLFAQGLDPLAWVEALAQPVQDGRISIWSDDATQQKALARSALGGPAARQRLAGDGAYAVYLNDNTGGKMATFLTTRIAAGIAACRADGRRTVDVSVSLGSTAPANAGSFPISMTGGGLWGVSAGDIGTIVSVSAPKGAFFGGVFLDGKLLASANVVDAGFSVSAAHVLLGPGETRVLTFRFVVDDAHAPVILHTPLLLGPELATAKPSCD